MLTFKKFQGINNVLPPERLEKSDLAIALNVDIGLSGEVRRRGGYSAQASACHKNLWNGPGFQLATVDGVLTAFDADGARVIHPALGTDRVWYCALPDGRVAFSNGSICGMTDGQVGRAWGVPVPVGVGDADNVPGGLHSGRYTYWITHVRLADGLEGAPAFGAAVDLPDGGILLSGLPELAGHGTNVYLSGNEGDECYLVGTTVGSAFTFTGTNQDLQLPCRTLHEVPAPAGRLLAFWRGRALVAVGDVLYASQPNRWEAFNPLRDFKQLGAPITLVQPVDDGIYVGTEQELAFLAGVQFDALSYRRVLPGHVVLGSGCAVPGDRLALGGDGAAPGAAMACIVGGHLVGGYAGGAVLRLAQYRTDAREVCSAFREVDGIPQYLAAVQ